MRVFWLVISFLCLTIGVKAQEQEKYRRSVRFYMMPLSLMDFTPRLRLGVEYHPNQDFAYSLDVGIGTSNLNSIRLKDVEWGDNYSLFEVRPEIKQFIKGKGFFRVYLGTEMFFILMKDDLSDGNYYKENGTPCIYFDKAEYNKMKCGVHFKGGAQIDLFNKLAIDVYTGFGLAYRKRYYADVINPHEHEHEHDYYDFEGWGSGWYKNEDESIIFHVSLGVKIGLIFWDRRRYNL